MAKSGGMLNNICAKLLKTTNTAEVPPGGHDVTNEETYGSHCDTQSEALFADVENNNASIKESVISGAEGGRAVPDYTVPPSDIPDAGNYLDFNPSSEPMSSMNDCETPKLSKPDPSSDNMPVLSHNSMEIASNSTPSSGGRSRRNRRKNATPRNIAQFKPDFSKDEIPEEYEIKNNVEKAMNNKEEWEEEDPLVKRIRIEEDNETALDLSAVSHSNQDSDSLATSTGSVHIETLAAEEYTMDTTGALDLSVAKNNKALPSDKLNVSNNSSALSNQSEDAPDPMDTTEFNDDEDNDSSQDSFAADFFQQRINHFLPTTALPAVPEKSPPRSDATTMKDYAQNTMNELLSLYGLGKQEAESITESVSLENFSSGSILARQPGQKLAASTALAAVAAEQQRSSNSSTQQQQKKQEAATAAALKAAVEGKSAALAGLAKTLGAGAPTPGEDSDSAPSSTASSPGTQPSEGIYAKFVSNISKLSKLPPGKTCV